MLGFSYEGVVKLAGCVEAAADAVESRNLAGIESGQERHTVEQRAVDEEAHCGRKGVPHSSQHYEAVSASRNT